MKNRNERHHFKITGGYDPAQDGDDPRWGRVAVACPRCGETRRVRISPAELALQNGCRRDGLDEPWQEGDLVVTPEGCLDQVTALKGDRVFTWNTGGRHNEWPLSDLRPA